MRILIIEDNHSKLKKIRDFIEKTYPNASVHDALSYTAGLRRLYQESWDYLLLDMSLPVFDMNIQDSGGDKKPIAGKEIMKRMLHKGIIIPTIIITQFDTFGEDGITIQMLNEEFSKNMKEVWKGTINYEKTSWMVDLKKVIDEISEEQIK